jgi:hypothetical protein
MMAVSAPSECSQPTSKGQFMSGVDEDLQLVPGIKFIDHVAISVKQGELYRQVEAYQMLGFQ